jgi:anti-sigma B factor antagonist
VERSSGAAPPRRFREDPRDKGADPELLAIEIERPGNGLTVVALAGELDLSTVPRLEGALLSEAQGQGSVVVDLTRLTFIDSSGIRLLIQAHQAADGRAPLRTVVADGSQVERVLALARIEKVLPVFLDREEAIGAGKTGRTASGE